MKSCKVAMFTKMGNIRAPMLCSVAYLCFASLASGQSACNAPANLCANVNAGQVNAHLAKLVIKLPKSVNKQHEPINVELVLRAGNNGIYLPNYFGDFITTCMTGFSANLFTLNSKLAKDGQGCGASVGHSTDDTALSEVHNFVHLAPGEIRIWRTTLVTTGLPPGRYQIVAEYLSSAYMIDKVARLPQVQGLMAQGRITAPPVVVTIR